MDAIIMAGGEGTRLKAVTGDTPKPMALLAGKPILEHILYLLKENGIKNACLALHYRPEAIQDYLGDGSRYGINLSYHVEREQLGTAGGVLACADFYGDRDFLVISGDCACDFNLKRLMEAHVRRAPAVTMALAAHEAPLQYGTVVTDRENRVVSFIEKPEWERVVTDLVNTGIYVISPAAMDFVARLGKPCDFARDLFPALMAAGQTLLGLPMEGYWCDIGTPRSYYQCNLDALDGRLRLAGRETPAPKPTAGSRPAKAEPSAREYRCASRARLMRELSQRVMEAGADFDLSDGVTLRFDRGEVRVTPSPERESLLIRASSQDPARAEALSLGCYRLLKGIDPATTQI